MRRAPASWRPWAAALLGLAVLTGPALPAFARATIELTAEPGVAIPCNRFLNQSGNGSSMQVANAPGFSFQLSLLLNNFEFHYGMSQVHLGGADIQLSPDLLAKVQQYNAQYGLNANVPADGHIHQDVGEWLTFHTLTVGYRIYVYDGHNVRLFIPNGLGSAIAKTPALSREVFGFNVNAGFGIDWKFLPKFPYVLLNATVRYHFLITEVPQEIMGANLLLGSQSWDSAVAMMHLFTFNVGIAGRW